jgi:integrase
MKVVQPIRDKALIERFKLELMKQSYRNYMIFHTGINTGIRVSDMLQLKVLDTKGSHISIIEGKTKKAKKFFINEQLRADFNRYTVGMKDDDYLFPTDEKYIKLKKYWTPVDGYNFPITRVQAYRILNDVAAKLGMEEVGCHTMRKSFGYWHYKQFGNIAVLQAIFNHSTPSVTRVYIGIAQNDMDETIEGFYL